MHIFWNARKYLNNEVSFLDINIGMAKDHGAKTTLYNNIVFMKAAICMYKGILGVVCLLVKPGSSKK